MSFHTPSAYHQEYKESCCFVMDHIRLYTLSVCGLGAAVAAIVLTVRARRPKPDREQLRRLWLSQTGRLTIGTTLDFQDVLDDKDQPVQLLIYRYDIAGVAYEASQDVTKLQGLIDVHSCRLGLPVSVRYDPHNPGNSIVISEVWSGLRK